MSSAAARRKQRNRRRGLRARGPRARDQARRAYLFPAQELVGGGVPRRARRGDLDGHDRDRGRALPGIEKERREEKRKCIFCFYHFFVNYYSKVPFNPLFVSKDSIRFCAVLFLRDHATLHSKSKREKKERKGGRG